VLSNIMARHAIDAPVILRCCTIICGMTSASLVAVEGANASAAEVASSARWKLCSGGIGDALITAIQCRCVQGSVAPSAEAAKTFDDAETDGSSDSSIVIVSLLEAVNSLVDGDATRAKLSGASDLIADILTVYRDHIEVMVATCTVIASLADSNGPNTERMLSVGLSPALVESLTRHHQNPDAVEAACRAINVLCLEKTNRSSLGSASCCEAVIKALDVQSSSVSTAVQCCLALGSLAHEVPKTAQIMASQGLCPLLEELYKRHSTHDSLAWAICRVTSYLSAEFVSLNSANMFTLIVTILKSRLPQNSTDGSASVTPAPASALLVIEWACRCIGCIAIDGAARLVLGDNGACEAIADALERLISTSSYISREGILALSCVCEGPEAVPNIERLKERAGQLVVAAIQAHFDDTEVAWCACKLLISLAQRPEYLVSIAAGDYVISVMQKHYKNSLVTDWGCRALSSLSSDEQYRDVLVGRGACDAIVQALKAAVSSDSLLSFVVQRLSAIPALNASLGAAGASAFLTKSALGASACNSIFSLADTHDDYRQRLGQAGACEAVVRVLLKYSSESSDVAGAACMSIISLCRGSPQHRAKLGAAGACKGIVTVLQKYATDEAVSFQACCALVALIADAAYIECSGELSNNVVRPTSAVSAQAETKHVRRNSANLYSSESTSIQELTGSITGENADVTQRQAASSSDASGSMPTSGAVQNDYQMLNVGRFGTAEGCDAIAMALQTHQGSERLARVGCWAVALLAGSDPVIVNRLGTVGACEAVVTMLQRHQEIPAVCQAGCIALARLAVNSGNSGWLGAAGGCNVVLDAVTRHPADHAVGRAGWAAIASLSCDEGNRSRFGLLLVCDAVVSTIAVCIEECRIATGQTDRASSSSTSSINLEPLFHVGEECCMALSNLAHDSDNLKRFYENRAVEVIITTLRTRGISTGLAANACGSVASLVAGTEQGRDFLGDKGACEAVVGCMEILGSNAFVAVQGSMALHSLCHRHAGNQARIGAAGGCEALLSTLRMHLWSSTVAENGCRAINSLVLDHAGNQSRLNSADACELIVRVVESHVKSEMAINRAACALFNLMVENGEAREQCWRARGCDALVAALLRHLNTEPVCVRIALTIKTLTFDFEGQNKLGDAGACKLLVNALSAHSGSLSAAPLLMSVIGCLALNHPPNQNKLNAAGACKAVITACQNHMKHESVLVETCRTILAIGDKNEDCKDKLAAVGAIELTNNILKACAKNQHTESELYELASSCKTLLAAKSPAGFFARQFAF
jgi:hypothetical protein